MDPMSRFEGAGVSYHPTKAYVLKSMVFFKDDETFTRSEPAREVGASL